MKECHIVQFLYILPLHEGSKGRKKSQTEHFTLDKDYCNDCSIPWQPLHNSVKIFLHSVRGITSPNERAEETSVILGIWFGACEQARGEDKYRGGTS